ncbi:MAG TPA: M67 family metallopeptidase [Tepidisphaeraceae bacterium]|jgi:proteasome lid subunit RPN8/RPN11|nr:M67 family metallopeptidase [Tepidisphaeraceae bacterium]
MQLILPPIFRQVIESHGADAFPNECCGMLVGRDVPGTGRMVEKLVKVPNDFPTVEQYHRFSIDPLLQLQTEKKAAAEGKMLLGFYHSHPDHPARPSEYDRAHAWPFYSYLIVSILAGKPDVMTCWVLDETTEQFVEQEIVDCLPR